MKYIIPLCYTDTIMSHSKVISTGIICIGMVASIFLFTKNDVVSSQEKNQKKIIQNVINIDTTKSDLDTDRDGLKDWEEILVGTDPINPDSDSDGTSDGKEVSAGRNPKKAGPNDTTTIENLVKKDVGVGETEHTLTEQVAKDFFSRYIAAKQQNVEMNSETAAQIANTSIQNVNLPEYTFYGPKDIKVSNDTSLEAKKVYADELGSAINRNSTKNVTNELNIFAKSLESQKEIDLLTLDLIITGYKKILKDTLAIQVPKDAAPEHLVYVNALSRIYIDISDMRMIISDPVRGYIGFSHYKQNALMLKFAFENLEAYFK